MGYGEYGGGGSIAWKVDIEDSNASGKKRAAASGYDPKAAQIFTVLLEYASAAVAQDDLDRLKNGGMTVDGNKIVFTVAVQQKNEDQIRVEW
jgi:hypothetical protein